MIPMVSGSPVTTADELLGLPGGERCELVRGVLKRLTPAGHVHGRVAARMLLRLAAHVDANRLGATYAAETGFVLHRNPDTVRAADASFVATARLDAASLQADGFFPGAPDLAVEVVSPSDGQREIREKVTDWLGAGCAVVIVLDPRKEVAQVHRAGRSLVTYSASDRLSIPDLLPGWSVKVGELFAAP